MTEHLGLAHARGLIHRDIKPVNLWIERRPGRNWRLKILDFGLVRNADGQSITQTGQLMGTPEYMSPEQADGLPVDARTDLFSFGTVLYRAASGASPFRGNSLTGTLRQVADFHPAPLSEIRPDLPAGFSELVRRMMEKAADGRPADAAEVLECLELTGSRGRPTRQKSALAVAVVAVEDGTASKAADPSNAKDPIFSKTFPSMKLHRIKAGTFTMGSPEGEKERSPHETQHEVTLTKDYYMAEHTVTVGQWRVFQKEESYDEKAGSAPSFKQEDDHPAVNVSCEDALAFCRWLSKKDGRTYRLPTEAEWEFACRAGTKTAFSFGDTSNGTEANCDGTFPYGTGVKGPYREGTSKVGSYVANPFGLYDVHGNVSEWCSDWYGVYPKGPITDPEGLASGSDWVLRGGSWDDLARGCRSALRSRYVPLVRYQGYACQFLSGERGQARCREGSPIVLERSGAGVMRNGGNIGVAGACPR